MIPVNLLVQTCPDRLYFAPLAWLKLQWFCHSGHTEVGGFGISAAHNPLYVEDFVTVKQFVSPVTVRFDDESVAELFDRLVDRGLPIQRFARLWIHTHPGDSPLPSTTDEETFARTFKTCDWALMFILSLTAQTYARLSFSVGPGGNVHVPVSVHWADWPEALKRVQNSGELLEQWRREYEANVHPDPLCLVPPDAGPEWWDRAPWSPELDEMIYEPVQQGANDEFPF